MASEKKSTKSSSRSSIEAAGGAKARFVVCVNNDGYPASLEKGKIYRAIPDAAAAKHGYMRIVDEEGEDYAYEAQRFFAVTIPRTLERSLLAPSPIIPTA